MVLDISKEVHERVWRSATMRATEGVSEMSFFAMGTRCRAAVAGADRPTENAYFKALLAQIIRFESTYSRFVPGSLVSQINAGTGKDTPRPWWLAFLRRETGPIEGDEGNNATPEGARTPNRMAVGAFQGALVVDPIRNDPA